MRLGLAQVPAFDQQALGPVYQANFVQLAVQLLIFAAERLQAVVRGGRQLDRLLQYLWDDRLTHHQHAGLGSGPVDHAHQLGAHQQHHRAQRGARQLHGQFQAGFIGQRGVDDHQRPCILSRGAPCFPAGCGGGGVEETDGSQRPS